MLVHHAPQPAQEAGRALDALVRPFQRLLRRRGEHHEQARGVGAVPLDQSPADRRRCSSTSTSCRCRRTPPACRRAQRRADAVPVRIDLHVDVGGIEVLDAARRRSCREKMWFSTMPCVSRLVNGSSTFDQAQVAHHARPEARIQQVQDRVLDAADVLVDRHPVVGALVDHRLRRWSAQAKRRKYQDESTKVSIVSVSRRAAPPHFGHLHLEERGRLVERIAGAVRHAGPRAARTGSCSSGTGTSPHVGAMDDRDRAAPVALARDAPVAQAPLHLLLAEALRLAGRRRSRRPPRW